MAGQGLGFVGDVGLALGMAAAASLVARRLDLPSIVSYLAAGLVLGPYLPVPIFADHERLHALSEFGVVLVMFAVGLELRLRRLLQVLPSSGFTGLVQMAALWWAGQGVGELLGWTRTEALFLGGCIAVSSTMVVSKVLERHPVAPDVRQHVFGVLVLQDVAAVALITLYTALASGADLSWSDFGVLVGGLAASLVGITAGGMLFVPRLVRRVVAEDSPELLAITAAGLCFGFALLAGSLGYSVALGAFVAGVLVAESGEAHAVEHAVGPLKEVFSAIFFVSVGMTVDPRQVAAHAGAVAAVSALVVAGQFVSVTGAGLLSGLGLRRSATAGLALGQVGEFGFVIAGIGAAAGVIGPAVSAVTVATAVVTTFTTPQLVGRADAVVRGLDHALPGPVHEALALHEAGIGTLRSHDPSAARVRSSLRALIVDVSLLLLLLTGANLAGPPAVRLATDGLGLEPRYARWVVLTALLLAATPIVAIIVRTATRTADAMAERIASDASLPPAALSALRLVLLLVVWFGAGVPILALLGPFLEGPLGPTLVLSGGAGLGLALWRALRGRDADVRSATARVVEVLGRSAAPDVRVAHDEARTAEWVPPVESLLRVTLPERSVAVGRTLAELDLRARTGAHVVGRIGPDGAPAPVPDPRSTRFAAGDTLVLLGSQEQTERGRALLTSSGEGSDATSEATA